jgi:V-type H+-transporting ATPase proteolipid subunit
MVLGLLLAAGDETSNSASFFGYMGIAAALVFCNLGAAYGTAKSGVGICSMGVLKPDLIFKSIVPIIMAGILGIYGLIVAVILNGKGKSPKHPSC